MAYDAAKAHDYYENYVKKGKKKGRKKGKSKKKTSSKATKLVGLSTAGLNDAGKMEVALVKERLQAEMNEALKKAATPAEKEKVRKEYQNKALKEISDIKSNASYATAKKSSTKKATGKSSSSSKGSSSSGKGGGASKAGSSGSSKSSSQEKKLNDIKNEIANLSKVIKNMSEDKKELVKEAVTEMIKKLSSMKGIDTSGLIEGLKKMSNEK